MNIQLCNPFQCNRFFLWVLATFLFTISESHAQTFQITPTGQNSFSIQISNVYSWQIQELVSNNWTRVAYGGSPAPVLNYTRAPGTYYFRLYNCYNVQGGCSTSSPKSITILPLTLSAPSLSVSGIENPSSNIDTNGTFSFTWSAVANAETYALERNGGVVYYDTTPSYSVASLGFGTYTFRVKACRENATICSNWSNNIAVTIQYPQPSLPSGPSFTGLENVSSKIDTDGSFTISWGESTWVENYLLQRNGIDWYWGPNRSYTVTGLQPGTYAYQVKACRDWATNCSSYTAPVTITVAAPAPSSSSRSSSSIALTSSSRSSSSVALTSSSRSSSSRSSSSVALTSSSRSSSSAAAIQSKTTRYTYDALGRLTFVEDPQNGNRDYDYDAAGNRLQVSTNTANDATAEPGVSSIAAPTGLSYNTHWGNGYDVRWTPVSGATYYRITFGTQTNYTVQGGSSNQFSTGANTSADHPNYIVACNPTLCSAKAYF